LKTGVLVLSALIFLILSCGAARAEGKEELKQEYKGSILVDGSVRTYLVHVPVSYNQDNPTPLVLALHGGGGNAAKTQKVTNNGFDLLSEKEGFIIVYPNGIEKNWNDGRDVRRYRAQRDKIDDVAFISALIDELAEEYNIDRARVYATGISNGAMMCLRLACELSDKIAAVAPVVGAMPVNLTFSCRPSEPVSLLFINGTDDPLVPWRGGSVRFGRLSLGRVISVPETVVLWASHDNCPVEPALTEEPDTDLKDGTRIKRATYGPCQDDTEIVFYTVEGGGHAWPGGYPYASVRFIGKTSRDMDACKVIWEFFKKHRRRE
jgi:polyhydroxybutyrate depolymerase